MFFMNCCRNKPSVWTCNWTAAFPVDCQWIKACRNNYAVVFCTNALCHIVKVNSLVARLVRNSDTATKVYEFNCNSALFLDFSTKFKQELCSIYEEVRVKFI